MRIVHHKINSLALKKGQLIHQALVGYFSGLKWFMHSLFSRERGEEFLTLCCSFYQINMASHYSIVCCTEKGTGTEEEGTR